MSAAFLRFVAPYLLAGAVASAPAGWLGYKLGHGIGYRAGVKAGGEAMAVAVEKQNAQAGEAARKVKRSVDECFARGGAWDQESGTCDK